ncbi:v-erb-like protein receptor precursor [Saccoglossus kowalevskii]|uniref:receptor protein-tyrosine kinase n=1 Tax=Saccoglossus kowalevskii TaxID=10224 RepID=D1LXH4_SACKO|nr:v-erb-like protein receptor precursor [Saccoglossus kowalevskii]ACY92680.1 v-erb-like protein receptor [Saccoglossus kowalevskii]
MEGMKLTSGFILCLLLFAHRISGDTKVCSGTSNSLSIMNDVAERYRRLTSLYGKQCTHINGNLEIVGLEDPGVDLTFLESIQEVSGYVLIALNYVPTMPLKSLRVIRGNSDWNTNALAVVLNYDPITEGLGLKELQFYNLLEISGTHNVNISSNRDLCYVDTIIWDDIIDPSTQKAVIRGVSNGKCKNCASDCDGHCWGSKNCQELTKTICHAKCKYRCKSSRKRDCCHSSCSAGCTGPSSQDCMACREFEHEGKCVEYCPPTYVYDPQFQGSCLDACPAHLVENDRHCVQTCPDGKITVKGKCHDCEGVCPKVCPGIGNPEFGAFEYVDERNIHAFQNCTIIEGNVIILPSTFNGDPFLGVVGISSQALEVFSSVQEITGHLALLHSSPEMKDFSVFGNLQIIRGQDLYNGVTALTVLETQVHSLGFSSLHNVNSGGIYVKENPNLCYVSKKLLSSLVLDENTQTIYLGNNKARGDCRDENKMCDMECTDVGCWGRGPENCFSCKKYNMEGVCVGSCDNDDGFFKVSKTECVMCDNECLDGCTGPGADECNDCKNMKDGEYCLEKCPSMKYANSRKLCRPCHEFCSIGCTGPSNLRKYGGCKACIRSKYLDDGTVECIDPAAPSFKCVSEDEDECLDQCTDLVDDQDSRILELEKEVAIYREQVTHLNEVLKLHFITEHGREFKESELKIS